MTAANTIVNTITFLQMDLRNDVIKVVQNIVNQHDFHYTSVNFGEDLIKEMIMASLFGILIAPKVKFIALLYSISTL